MAYQYLGEKKKAQIPAAVFCQHVRELKEILQRGEKALEMQGLYVDWDRLRFLEDHCLDKQVDARMMRD